MSACATTADHGARLRDAFSRSIPERQKDGRFVGRHKIQRQILHQQMREHLGVAVPLVSAAAWVAPMGHEHCFAGERQASAPKDWHPCWAWMVPAANDMIAAVIACGMLCAAGWPS
jgi:hypothetical protein